METKSAILPAVISHKLRIYNRYRSDTGISYDVRSECENIVRMGHFCIGYLPFSTTRSSWKLHDTLYKYPPWCTQMFESFKFSKGLSSPWNRFFFNLNSLTFYCLKRQLLGNRLCKFLEWVPNTGTDNCLGFERKTFKLLKLRINTNTCCYSGYNKNKYLNKKFHVSSLTFYASLIVDAWTN